MSDEKEYGKAIAHLKAQCAVHGYAALQFKDSEIIMFSKEMLQGLIAKIEKSGENEALIMIQHSGKVLRSV